MDNSDWGPKLPFFALTLEDELNENGMVTSNRFFFEIITSMWTQHIMAPS